MLDALSLAREIIVARFYYFATINVLPAVRGKGWHRTREN
jgi:hypothetical protein